MRKALVVVDYQVDFVSGSMGSEDAKAIERSLYDRVEKALADGESVYFTRDTHGDNYSDTDEGRHIPVSHCVKGTEGHEIYGSLRALSEKCHILDKGTFGSPELAELLSREGFDEIEIAGVATNICVLANAVLVKTAMPESHVYIDRRNVASYDRSLGQSALDILAAMCIDIV